MFKTIKIRRLVKEYNQICKSIANNPALVHMDAYAKRNALAEEINRLRK